MTISRRGIGQWGETQACAFLTRQGFSVIERNFFTTAGEIDIIARKGDDVYFVEVKTRQTGAMAYDLALTYEKKRRMRKAMASYCYKRRVAEVGIIPASLMVVIDKATLKVRFRLAMLL